jgi:hypothetical protein
VVLAAVRGRILFRDGEVLTLDAAAIGEAVDEAAARLGEHLP